DSKQALIASAKLGQRVADLLNTERKVPGVDSEKVASNLVTIAVVTRLSKETLNLSLTAGWGHAGKQGVTMPGKGKVNRRAFAPNEPNPVLGEHTYDIYLNDSTCWTNIPEKVWDFTIGGYQVIKKWLSYREFELLGRALTPDE